MDERRDAAVVLSARRGPGRLPALPAALLSLRASLVTSLSSVTSALSRAKLDCFVASSTGLS